VWDGPNKVHASIPKNSLDAYLVERGLKEVEITIDMTEILIQLPDGTSYYQLTFVFGPSGAYFDPNDPLKLTLNGKYASASTTVWLYNEMGELLEGKRTSGNGEMTFYIPHFSNYYYDRYY